MLGMCLTTSGSGHSQLFNNQRNRPHAGKHTTLPAMASPNKATSHLASHNSLQTRAVDIAFKLSLNDIQLTLKKVV